MWPFCYQFADVLRPQPRRSVPNIDAPGRTVSAIVESRNLDLKIVATLQERFGEAITTEQELRNIVGPANRWFTSKILNKLDRRCQDFIAASPFVVVGSTDPSGLVDLSPEGRSRGIRKVS